MDYIPHYKIIIVNGHAQYSIFPNVSDAYYMFTKQMGNSTSTENLKPCNKNCYCIKHN